MQHQRSPETTTNRSLSSALIDSDPLRATRLSDTPALRRATRLSDAPALRNRVSRNNGDRNQVIAGHVDCSGEREGAQLREEQHESQSVDKEGFEHFILRLRCRSLTMLEDHRVASFIRPQRPRTVIVETYRFSLQVGSSRL